MPLQKKNGYSMVEILVYLAVFTATSILVINSFVVVISSFNITRIHRDLLEAGSTVMERMSREIRQSTGVDVVNSTISTSPGVLSLTTANGTDKFITSSGSVAFYSNGVLVGNLFGSNISVTNLVFRRITTTAGEAIKIEMTLQDTRGRLTRSANFYNTIILREVY